MRRGHGRHQEQNEPADQRLVRMGDHRIPHVHVGAGEPSRQVPAVPPPEPVSDGEQECQHGDDLRRRPDPNLCHRHHCPDSPVCRAGARPLSVP
jgi:hypothetical protein